jgi:hypothetical protein
MIDQSTALLNHVCAGYVEILSTHVHTQGARSRRSTGLDARTFRPHVRPAARFCNQLCRNFL